MEKMLASAKEAVAWVKAKMETLSKRASEETEELVSEVKDEELFVEEAVKDTFKRRLASARERACALVAKLSPKERMAILFAIGVLLGFGAKTLSASSITIGYRDYTAPKEGVYDLIALQKKVNESGSTGAFTGGSQPSGACVQ